MKHGDFLAQKDTIGKLLLDNGNGYGTLSCFQRDQIVRVYRNEFGIRVIELTGVSTIYTNVPLAGWAPWDSAEYERRDQT